MPNSAINKTPRFVLGGAKTDNSTTSPSSIFRTVELKTKPVAESFTKYGIKTETSPAASKLIVWKRPPVHTLGDTSSDSDESTSTWLSPKQPDKGANNIKQTKPKAVPKSFPIHTFQHFSLSQFFDGMCSIL